MPLTPSSRRRTVSSPRAAKRRAVACALAVGIGVVWAAPTEAHFILETPASWMSQDSVGLPEKLGPCGDEGGGTPTGTVTAFQSGQTITVTISEAIFHPGHYRIALATDPSQLPAEPPVDAGSNSPCGTVPVENPPVFPVLADGVFDHTAPFTSPQSVQITLPDNFTCDKCTLQVIEFMSDHPLNNPGGCFYHHCADISIKAGAVDGGGASDDATVGSSGASSSGAGSGSSTGSSGGHSTSSGSSMGSSGGAGGTGGTGDSSSGCSFAAAGAGQLAGVAPVGVLLLAGAVVRRRRSSARTAHGAGRAARSGGGTS